MNQPDVTLTDYALAAECLTFCALILRRGGWRGLSGWSALMFAAIGVSAFAGGTVHGFFHDHTTVLRRTFWTTSMIALGIVALSGWMIGLRLLRLSGKAATAVKTVAGAGFAAYAVYVAFVSQKFLVAIAQYAPAAVFLLAAFAYRYVKGQERAAALGMAAMGLVLASSLAQQAKIALHPVYFDHNALYHLVQFVALVLLYRSVRHYLEEAELSGTKGPHQSPTLAAARPRP